MFPFFHPGAEVFFPARPRCASIWRARSRCSLRCARLTRPLLQLKPARRPARETARPRSARRGAARLTAEAGASAAHALCAPRHLHRRHLPARRLRALALPRWRAMRMSRAALAGAVRKKVLQRSMCETRAPGPGRPFWRLQQMPSQFGPGASSFSRVGPLPALQVQVVRLLREPKSGPLAAACSGSRRRASSGARLAGCRAGPCVCGPERLHAEAPR